MAREDFARDLAWSCGGSQRNSQRVFLDGDAAMRAQFGLALLAVLCTVVGLT